MATEWTPALHESILTSGFRPGLALRIHAPKIAADLGGCDLLASCPPPAEAFSGETWQAVALIAATLPAGSGCAPARLTAADADGACPPKPACNLKESDCHAKERSPGVRPARLMRSCWTSPASTEKGQGEWNPPRTSRRTDTHPAVG